MTVTALPALVSDTCAVWWGNSLTVLAGMPDSSVDAVICDPPYELSFMNKGWDGSGIAYSVPLWQECLRVLKPGGHLLAFGGTRTYHRMAVAVEDAGFEIRDSLAWMYGSGFPKSMDVGKAIDKQDAGPVRLARAYMFTAWMRSTGITAAQISALTGTSSMGQHFLTETSQPAVATADLFDVLRPHLPSVPADIEKLVADRTVESETFKQRKIVGTTIRTSGHVFDNLTYNPAGVLGNKECPITEPATDEARRWTGWGTALKPAYEPIVVARKPLSKGLTVAGNVLRWGTGALNIDACRIAMSNQDRIAARVPMGSFKVDGKFSAQWASGRSGVVFEPQPAGRWPANLLLSHTLWCVESVAVWDCEPGCPVAELDTQSGVTTSRDAVRHHKATFGNKATNWLKSPDRTGNQEYADTGGASRFFTITDADPDLPAFRYGPKAPKRERPVAPDGTRHPTVKPLAIMRHLIRLVCPPDGIVLDPFAGSGTTVEACLLEGVRCAAVELEATHMPLILSRMARHTWTAAPAGLPGFVDPDGMGIRVDRDAA